MIDEQTLRSLEAHGDPLNWWAAIEPKPAVSDGARAFALAMIECNVRDLLDPKFRMGAERWFRGGPATLTFAWCCYAIGQEPSRLGPALLAWKARG